MSLKKNLIAGTDEVGRGCLAGPVVAAAVILKNKVDNLDDSKKLSTKKRNLLSKKILENSYYGFGIVSNNEIDKINILNASLLAMKRAILNLPIKPALVLVDGIYKPDLNIPMKTIIGGDSIEDAIIIEFIFDKPSILEACDTKKALILFPPLIELYFIAFASTLLSSFSSNR